MDITINHGSGLLEKYILKHLIADEFSNIAPARLTAVNQLGFIDVQVNTL